MSHKKLEKSTENNIGIKTLQTPNLVSLAFLSLSVLYIPIAIAYNSPELAFRNLFIIYYVFIAMISVLMMLYLDKNPKCYLLSRANTLLLFVVGAIMTIYELTTKNTFYPMVYLWIAALIISVYLYIAKKKRSWIYALSVTVTVALYCSVTYLFPMVKDMGAACICGSLFMVLLTVFLIATRLRKESLPFENDCFMILTALVHIFMLLCFTSWLKFPDTSCIIGALLLCMAAVCQWALYQKEHNISGMISLLTFFPIINKLADYAVFDTNMKMLLYIIIFGSFLLLGRLLYPERMIVISREEGEQRVLIDWVGFGSIISLIFMQQSGEKIWIFMAELLFAGYLMNMIKRTPEKLEKVIYSFALFSAILALVTQPFVELPSLFRTELYLLFLILLAAGMQKIIWKTKVPLIYICTVISIVIQSAECLYREILFKDGLWDLLFLALVLLALLILSFWLQSKKWFGLSGISLVTIAVYCTRDFWKSISWWIYLMAAGILLIVIAVVKEYQKRNVDQEHSKFYQIKEYWEEWK